MHLALFIPTKKGIGGKVFGVCSLYFIFAYTFAGSPDNYRTEIKNLYLPLPQLRQASPEDETTTTKSENTDQ
jgi:hypothetical protein